MKNKITKQQKQNTSNKTYVIATRLNESEYNRLLHESLITGKNKSTLLREIYFTDKTTAQLMPKEDAINIYTELIRIGNNIKIISEKLNGGFREGFNKHLEEIEENIAVLKIFVSGSYGNH